MKEDPVARYIRVTGLKYLPPRVEDVPDVPVVASNPEVGSLVGVEDKTACTWPDVPNSQLNWTKEEKNRVYNNGLKTYGYFQKGQDNEN